MNNRRRFPRIFFVLTFFGVMNLLAMLSNPALANIRGVDVVRLIGTGMCFGAAIIYFVAYFRDLKQQTNLCRQLELAKTTKLYMCHRLTGVWRHVAFSFAEKIILRTLSPPALEPLMTSITFPFPRFSSFAFYHFIVFFFRKLEHPFS